MRTPGFPGSNSQKKEARVLLYQQALGRPRVGAAVTLAGPTPEEELDLLRNYLRWEGEQTWFVDNSTKPEVKKGLNKVQKMWPEARTDSRNLRNVLKDLPVIGFANLDFMGYMTESNLLPCLASTAQRMVSGAIMGLTWYRGRENLGCHVSARRVFHEGRDHEDIADRRWAGTLRIVDQTTKGCLKILKAVEYHNGQSPMSMVVYEKR